MEEQINKLVGKTWARFQDTSPDRRLIVAVSGIPGSGKTSLATTVTTRLNQLAAGASHPSDIPVAIFVPMDGYHYTRAQLSEMPDPSKAHFWRGAAFTFDATAFVRLLRKVREPLTASTPTIRAPSFNHKIKDPVEDDIAIPASARIVIFEGNYLSLQKGEWAAISNLVDERWFIEVDNSIARERLAKRHAAAGIVDSVDQGRERADTMDLINGEEVRKYRGPIDEEIVSREDAAWRPEHQNSS